MSSFINPKAATFKNIDWFYFQVVLFLNISIHSVFNVEIKSEIGFCQSELVLQLLDFEV